MKRLVPLALLASGLFVLAACTSSQTDTSSGSSASSAMAPADHTQASSSAAAMEASSPAQAATQTAVTIQNFAFTPQNLTVKAGTVVTWTNQDGAPHTVTGDNGGPDSQHLSQGQSYSFRFDTAGTFPYHCAVHPNMKGSVTVLP